MAQSLSGGSNPSRKFLSVERILQLHVAVLASLGTLLLGLGQQNFLLPVAMLIAATSAFVFTDILGWFRLHRIVANLAAIVAVIFSLSDFLGQTSQDQLLAIANLLIYLQVVLLFQRKQDRIYWQLAVLSLLQVVVAAALSVGVEFGFLLIVFVMLAFSTLGIFYIHRLTNRSQRLRDARAESPGGTVPDASQPLLGQPAQIDYGNNAAQVGRELVGRNFARQVIAIGVATLVFAAAFFYSVPRSSTYWRGSGSRQPVTGFSRQFSLNEMSKVVQSDELVMRVQFQDVDTRLPYRVFGEPYLRGMVFTQYDYPGGTGNWSNDRNPERALAAGRRDEEGPRPLSSLPAIEDRGDVNWVRQEILLEPTTESLVFGVSPAFRVDSSSERLRYDHRSGQLFRRRYQSDRNSYFRCAVATPAFRNGSQLAFTPYRAQSAQSYGKLVLASDLRSMTDNFDPRRMPELARLADQVLVDAGYDGSDRVRTADLLENFFIDPARFTYTLDFAEVDKMRTPLIDPIEDFVSGHRHGHCEYFASGLVMMLRSRGIPARVVVGYRGGEFNRMGGYFKVRQKHAHAWVEAFIEPQDLPADLAADPTVLGAWLRLDPTPAASLEGDEFASNSVLETMDQAMDYAQLLWNDYVVGLTPERQQRTVYQPLGESASLMTDREAWQQYLQRLLRRNADGPSLLSPRGVLLVVVILGCLAALVQMLWRRRKRGKRWWGGETETDGRIREPIAFYHRLECMLNERGLRREPAQTQREFAASVAAELAPSSERPALAALLRIVIEAFYRVRFGGPALDKKEMQAIEQALQRLEQFAAAVESEKTGRRAAPHSGS